MVFFKEATTAGEFQQIHSLNHRVFAEEVAQHATTPTGLLIDRFHGKNRYFIAIHDQAVVGMISAHAGPEFSVARRLPAPALLKRLSNPVEVRLLAIEPRMRNRTILAGLFWQVYQYALGEGFSHVLISAIAERTTMYGKLGFVPLGPAVPEGAASFVPMVLTIGPEQQADCRTALYERHWRRVCRVENATTPVSLLPGPICVSQTVKAAFSSPPVSHRSPAFTQMYEEVRGLLAMLAGGRNVAIFPGSGTLANDLVAANLKAIFGNAKGLILANGEFGERLCLQATQAGLYFDRLNFSWGAPWSVDALEQGISRKPAWIWAVHLETSTGVLNDAALLLELAGRNGSSVALDCVSSLGAIPLPQDPNTLLLASGVSGKSLGAYAGLAFVFFSEAGRALLKKERLCVSFDLLRNADTLGPLTTIPSPSLAALAAALQDSYSTSAAAQARYTAYTRLGRWTRDQLRTVGMAPIAPEHIAAPNITSFALPNSSLARLCAEAGYLIGADSGYLKLRGWGQIGTMGDLDEKRLEPLFGYLAEQLQILKTPACSMNAL